MNDLLLRLRDKGQYGDQIVFEGTPVDLVAPHRRTPRGLRRHLTGIHRHWSDSYRLQTSRVGLTVPQQGMTDSLNLAVSVGIVLFEFFRQAPTS
jgi:hypothetical protein